MNINQLKKSNFLTRGDVGKGLLLTIEKVQQENVAKEGAPEELRWCMYFTEVDKPMVLNSTNGQIIASITKSDESDDWAGHKIVAYDDPNVSFGGKLVGGIRVRAPRNQPAKPATGKSTPATSKPAPEPEHLPDGEDGDSSVPF